MVLMLFYLHSNVYLQRIWCDGTTESYATIKNNIFSVSKAAWYIDNLYTIIVLL